MAGKSVDNTTPIRHTSSLFPSLSTKGWVGGLYEKADLIFANYLVTRHSDTVIHRDYVLSMAYSVQEYYSRPSLLQDKLESDLTQLYSDYFDHVDIKVDYKERDGTGIYDFTIYMDIRHAGFRWDLSKNILIEDSKFKVLTDINNGVTTRYSMI